MITAVYWISWKIILDDPVWKKNMFAILKSLPVIGPCVRRINRNIFRCMNKLLPNRFQGSEQYWINRYNYDGNSGAGSYRHLAKFKADTINAFVEENNVSSVIEYGCGDGNQLRTTNYPSYIGFDVSAKAIALCKSLYVQDGGKMFKLQSEYNGEMADLTLSLDVVYHLVEDDVFDGYMRRLFDSARSYVIIYSSNTNQQEHGQAPHVRHRRFTDWVDREKPEWRCIKRIPNKYPYQGDMKRGSFADFYIYSRQNDSAK